MKETLDESLAKFEQANTESEKAADDTVAQFSDPSKFAHTAQSRELLANALAAKFRTAGVRLIVNALSAYLAAQEKALAQSSKEQSAALLRSEQIAQSSKRATWVAAGAAVAAIVVSIAQIIVALIQSSKP